jgi:large subunit ribosomal protein L15
MFQATPVTRLAVPEGKKFPYALPDPIKRKDLEYYRDVSKRGYLSYMVPAGQTPSLFFKTPGVGAARKDKVEVAGKENRLW